eukprot:12077759-Alexandrium_andersonii.AAC.1
MAGRTEREEELVGEVDVSQDFVPSALVAPGPAHAPGDECGWAVFHRLADWAAHQARWLGSSSIRGGVAGSTALGVATLWTL